MKANLIVLSIFVPFAILVGLAIVLPAGLAALQRRKLVASRTLREQDSGALLAAVGVPQDVAGAVIAYLRKWIGSATFDVKPTDSLGEVYGIYDDDLDDAFRSVISAVNQTTTDEAEAAPPTIVTVEDFARAVVARRSR